MVVSLSKGSSVSLTKEAGPVRLSRILVGLGWDPGESGGPPFDLDASALILGPNGRVISDEHFIFYGHLGDVVLPGTSEPDVDRASVCHHGDNLTGDGEGDDEQITVHLDRLPPAADRVVFLVSIYESDVRGQTFGRVTNAFIRVENAVNATELARFDLSSGASNESAVAFGELYRDGAEWRFGALGEPYPGGLAGAIRAFGVNV